MFVLIGAGLGRRCKTVDGPQTVASVSFCSWLKRKEKIVTCFFSLISLPPQGVLPRRLQPGVHLPHLHPSHRLWQLQVSGGEKRYKINKEVTFHLTDLISVFSGFGRVFSGGRGKWSAETTHSPAHFRCSIVVFFTRVVMMMMMTTTLDVQLDGVIGF